MRGAPGFIGEEMRPREGLVGQPPDVWDWLGEALSNRANTVVLKN